MKFCIEIQLGNTHKFPSYTFCIWPKFLVLLTIHFFFKIHKYLLSRWNCSEMSLIRKVGNDTMYVHAKIIKNPMTNKLSNSNYLSVLYPHTKLWLLRHIDLTGKILDQIEWNFALRFNLAIHTSFFLTLFAFDQNFRCY